MMQNGARKRPFVSWMIFFLQMSQFALSQLSWRYARG